MAKVKKAESNNDEDIAEADTTQVTTKPRGTGKKLCKSIAEMITAAFAELKNHNGHSLAAIRNFATHYKVKMTKQRLGLIKISLLPNSKLVELKWQIRSTSKKRFKFIVQK